jgi:Fe-S cluster assembly protein SufD
MEAGLTALARARAAGPGRAAALAAFERVGLPHRRIETWKWTDIRAALAGEPPAEAQEDVVGRSLFAGVNAFEITIMNGEATWTGAPPAGVEIALVENDGALPPATADHPLANLCAASAERRLDMRISGKIAKPIHLRQVAAPGSHHVFAQARLLAGAEASVLQSFDGAGTYFSNSHFGFGLDEGARLFRYIVQDGSADGVDAAVAGVRVAKAATFRQTALLLGAKAARFETRVFCLEPDAQVELASAAIVEDSRHADQTSLISFHASGATAAQTHKSALRGRARGVFQGKFHVTREGQKTDAQMSARSLLLNEGAEANHKPELEIYADDVKCGHGSTVGALDEEALFYFRQRGLDPERARALLVAAFIVDVFDRVEESAIRAAFDNRIARWLEGAS